MIEQTALLGSKGMDAGSMASLSSRAKAKAMVFITLCRLALLMAMRTPNGLKLDYLCLVNFLPLPLANAWNVLQPTADTNVVPSSIYAATYMFVLLTHRVINK